MVSNNAIIYDLSGEWDFQLGAYSKEITKGIHKLNKNSTETVLLPGTMDENKKGTLTTYQDQEKLSRYYTYTGPALYQKSVNIPEEWKDKEIIFYIERSRATKLYVNGTEVLAPETSSILAVPQKYYVTKHIMWGGDNQFSIVVDNSYPNMPAEAILYSSMATEETQTNWNGMVGKVELQVVAAVHIKEVLVYPNTDLKSVRAICEVTNKSSKNYTGYLQLEVEDLPLREIIIQLMPGITTSYEISDFYLGEDIRLWDEFNPELYTMKVYLKNILGEDNDSNKTIDIDKSINIQNGHQPGMYTTNFGMRAFTVNHESGRLMNNYQDVFLRCEANCAIFPLTGYAPMDEESWEELFKTYQAYGVNTIRFHSWCPPKAAFAVADRRGLFLQPELSCWDHIHMFGDELDKEYYTKEARAILKNYSNHPSFVMLTLGNELHFDDLAFAGDLLEELKEMDSTRLYSYASNGYYGKLPPVKNSDFYTAQNYLDSPLRGMYSGMKGFINEEHPGSTVNYEVGAQRVINGGHPVFSFEVGQYQVFPDILKETNKYTGVLEPRNFKLLIKLLKEKKIDNETVKKYIDASGMLSKIGYRQEIEAARRTSNLSGISLLGIQDFSGQGTALVGMMNALGKPKPYEFANPQEFMNFFGKQVILFETEKFCLSNSEFLNGNILVSNYGDTCLNGLLTYQLIGRNGAIFAQGALDNNCYSNANMTVAGSITIPLMEVNETIQFKLVLSLERIQNTYDFWVYPEIIEDNSVCVYITEVLDEKTEDILKNGGKVLLSPNPIVDNFPNSVVGTFTTSFWSSIFVSETQPGTMGLLMDPKHQVFNSFPTEFHTNYQWWPMTKLGRAMILEDLIDTNGNIIKPIIQVIDGFLTLRTMGLLYEVQVGTGKLMVSSLGLEQHKDQYPEVKALRNSILKYMNSEAFNPESTVEIVRIKNEVR